MFYTGEWIGKYKENVQKKPLRRGFFKISANIWMFIIRLSII